MNTTRRYLAAAVAMAAATSLHAQSAGQPLPEKAKDAASRAMELIGNKAKGIEDTLSKVAPSVAKEAENAPKALQPLAKALSTAARTPFPRSAAKPAVRKDDPSQWAKDSTRKLAVMDVEFGDDTQTIMFELYQKDAPGTVGNFIDNCESKAYNGLAIHRAIDGYLVQTGDPLTADDTRRADWGTGGGDRTIPGEFKRNHSIGSVAMARKSDKVNPKHESNSHQFYFALGNMGGLDGSYTVFGQVVSGLDILQRISNAPADANDCPVQRIEVKSVKVIDHKGPLITMRSTGYSTEDNGKRRSTKPSAAKTGWERVLERIW
jgi:cyclophilin family peptidyl-prolyl cis-trans isomerase